MRLGLLRLEGDNQVQRASQFQQTLKCNIQEKNICSKCELPELKVMSLTFRVFVNTNLTSFKSSINVALL